MDRDDTVKLLRECDAGVKMGIKSIDDVIDNVGNRDMTHILMKGKQEHEQIEEDLSQLLDEYDAREKEPNPMAQVMSWVKTNAKMIMDESDKTIADLMTDGCNMGIKSLQRYLNQYANAEKKVQEIARKIIHSEECIQVGMKAYL